MTKSFFLTPIFFIGATAHAADVNLTGISTFDAIGKPSMLKIHGEDKQVRGNLKLDGKNLSGEFLVKLDDFNTGMKLRDQHMKNKYLEIDKYPEAKLKLEPITLPSLSGELKKLPFKGTLTLHGVEKPVSGETNISLNSNIQNIDASFSTKLSDFGIQIPAFAGVTVAEEIQIHAELKP